MRKKQIHWPIIAVILVIATIMVYCFAFREKRTSSTKPPAMHNDERELTLDVLKNAEYNSQYGRVRLKNGIYEEQYPNSASIIYVGIYKNMIIFGDLNNDGEKDAVLVIDSYGGGSGHFYELAVVVNDNGKSTHLSSTNLGDRVIINSISINKAGEVTLSMITHGPNDALVCPTLEKIVKYKLYENELLEIKKET